MVITRKIALTVVGNKEEKDRVYTYIRDGIKNQNLAMNQYMSALYVANMQDISKDDRKELNHLYTRISTSKKGSAYSTDIQFPKGLPCTSSLGQEVRAKFKKACKDGLMYGRVSLPTYRANNPLLIHVDYVRLRSTNPHNDTGLYHNYESHTEFLEHLYKNDCEVFIKFANNITFQLFFGQPHKSHELRSVIQKVFEEYYSVCGSSIEISKKGKIMLNMCIEIPVEKKELDENIVVGVDLGISTPAMCGLNCNDYVREGIGSKDTLLSKRTQLQRQYRELQGRMKMTNGGHGRGKKLKKMDDYRNHERHFVQTYNHQVSKKIVDFALKYKAKYINVEDLSGFGNRDTNQWVLRNWSYYELQQYITYKAQKYGIEVRKVKPYLTSQTCSHCGHYEPGQRLDQAHFECKNCGLKINADFNASRNIAMSTEFV